MLSTMDVARYFLAKGDPEAGDLLSNLKLQKLCYYAQGFHLAIYDKPLFREKILAWAHGPVVPSVYHKFKKYEANGIPVPEDMDFSIYDDEMRDFLDEVYSVYGQYSAWRLRTMTHEEPPWKEAFESGGAITHESMKKYFRTRLRKK